MQELSQAPTQRVASPLSSILKGRCNMKKLIAVVLLVVMTSSAFAEVFVDEGQAAYIGGTLVNIKNETMGKLDTTQEKALQFNYDGGKVTIPYDRIESWK